MNSALAVMLSLTFMFSCTVKELETGSPAPKEGTAVLQAVIGEESRAVLDGTQILWQEGDQINVITRSSHNCGAYTLVDGAGTTTGRFSGGDIEDCPEYYALYPHGKSYTKSNERYRFSVPKEQTWQNESVGRGANVMVATFTDPSEPLQFRNVMGLLKLSLVGSQKVYKISVTDADESHQLWGKAALLLNGTQGTASQDLEFSEGDNTLELNCPGGVQLSPVATPFYIAAPPGSFASGMSINIYGSNTSEPLETISTTKDNSIVRSAVRAMPVKEISSAVTIPEDLSFTEPANCYVVNGSGDFKFKTVKGNSNESVGAVADAVVLWESNGTTVAPQVGDIVANPVYSDGYINFTATGTAGNALIAARDNQGNILWSWHIWVPGAKIKAATYSNASSGGVMDRNLGALSTTEGNPLSNGLLYQWGRKDPFPGSAGYSNGNPVVATSGSITCDSSSDTKGTEEYSIAHPTEFLYCPSSVQSNQDWVYGGNNTHWAASKTVWDPCPPGYRVPTNGIWANLGFENGSYAMKLDGKHWYPVAGWRWSSDGAVHGATANGYYWTASAGANQATYGKYTYGSTCTFEPSKSMSRSAGLSVRCCTDITPVEEPSEGSDKAFFTALPEGTLLNGIESGDGSFTLNFSNGSSTTLSSSRSALLQVSDSGNWLVNGENSNYQYASTPLYRIDPATGNWLSDGVSTGVSALGSPVSYADQEVTSVVEQARKICVNFPDGTSLSYPKNIDWGMCVQKTADKLYVYMGHSSSSKWIRYSYSWRHKDYTGGTTYPDYYDNWGLGKPGTCTRNGNSFTFGEELFLGGEAEAAVETYAWDSSTSKKYSGGVLHGWENMCIEGGNRMFSLSIDGNPVGETATVSLSSASLVEIEQTTLIARAYSPEGTDNAYAKVKKHWTFKDGTVSISVEYEFLSETELFQSMFGMFCVKRLRTAGDTASGYITNLAWKDNAPYVMYAVPEGWESSVSASAPLKSKDNATTRVEEFGEAGVSFAMQFDGGTLKSKGGFKIGTNGNNYNKIYFDLSGNYTAAVGEKLNSTVHWEIDYIEDYNLF
ncbi:MAG: hypothetical protein J5764_05070 [Bacteroidales bacterium]|nr:hypothetical protein [Bacteroidales bacterium]